MNDRALLDLLCRSLADAEDPELGEWLTRADVPWERLLDLANRTRVTPALHWRLKERGLLPHLDGDVRDYLDGIAELAELRNEKHLDQLVRVARILNGGGIRPLVLKGAASLVTGLYPAIGARHMFDVDVLVQRDRFGDAIEALFRGGYRIVDPARAVGVPRGQRTPFDFTAARHYPRLSRAVDDPPVEVHHRVTTARLADVLPTEELVSAASALRWRGVDLLVPSRLHRMLHQVIHAWMEGSWITGPAIPFHPMLLHAVEFRRLSAGLTGSEWSLIAARLQRVGRRRSLERYVALMQRLARHHAPDAVHPGRAARALAPLVGGIWPPPGPWRCLLVTSLAVPSKLRHFVTSPGRLSRLTDPRRWRSFGSEVAGAGSW